MGVKQGWVASSRRGWLDERAAQALGACSPGLHGGSLAATWRGAADQLSLLRHGGNACRGAGGTNVTVEDDPSDPAGLLCVAARDISAGEELFMDYGPTYDRSRYTADVAAGPGGARQQDPAERGESV